MPAFEETSLALPSALTASLAPDELVDRLAEAGLRGRGGGWFPVARKWRAVRAEGGQPLVVANGAEGEPGSVKDRFVMLTRPHEVLQGLALAARAVGAREAVVYLKGSFHAPAEALREALRRQGVAGVEVSIRQGDDSYVAGEETAVLEVLEGRRAWPRPKPPLPYAVGFQGRPTLVQNVDTLARVPAAVADPVAFRAGDTAWVSLWGHVRRPGIYEARLGTPLSRIIEDAGGGAPDGISLVFPAGPSAAPLPAAQVDLPLDPDALRAAGSGLGTSAVLVVRARACPVAVGVSLAGFFERESCGQCPPCTMGTASLSRVLKAIEEGTARASQVAALSDVSGFMSSHGYCAHSRTAAGVVTALLALARREVDEHIARGGCPRPEGRGDPFAPDSLERAAIEAALMKAVS